MHHAREESQHAIIDELEWKREDVKLTPAERDKAVGDLISLVGAVDGILQAQARVDAGYFLASISRVMTAEQASQVREAFLAAYRYQYIVSGVKDARFQQVLGGMITPQQGERIGAALAPILQ
jgi:hypothetical protein